MGSLAAQLPSTTRVIVVEEAGNIVACVTGMLVLHAENLWIAPTHRKRAGVWRSLMRSFWGEVAGEFGTSGAWASSVTSEMQAVLTRLRGTPVPGHHVILPKGDS
jgi:hypothetical protein